MENRVSHANATPDKITREEHPELYLANGDIVLQAKLPSDTENPRFQMYCVHKAVLSFHSTVFSNLFADGSANLNSESIYDGHPLVEMPDDADDLSNLLLFIYKPSDYLMRSSHPDTPFELRGAVRLASKYMLDGARSDMIKRVTMDWPTTLDDWDIREGEREGLVRLWRSQYPNTSSHFATQRAIAERTLDPVSAIVFAQEHGCTEILPAAFYRLASIDISAEWQLSCYLSAEPPCARWSLCDKGNLVRYIKGRQALEGYHHAVARQMVAGEMLSENCLPWWFIDPPSPALDDDLFEEYTKDAPCFHFIWNLRELAWGTQPSYDPLAALSKLWEAERSPSEKLKGRCPDGLCYECKDALRRWIRSAREGLWECLPNYFQLQ